MHDTEGQLALNRFVRELETNNAVGSIYDLMEETELHVWVVLRQASRDARYQVYAAQLATDPDFLLILHFVDSPDAVPSMAHRVDHVRA